MGGGHNQIDKALVDILSIYTFTTKGGSGYGVGASYGQGIAISPHLIITARHVVSPPKKVFYLLTEVSVNISSFETYLIDRKDKNKEGFFKNERIYIIWENEKSDLALVYSEEKLDFYWKGFGKAKIGDTAFFANSRFTLSSMIIKTEISGIGLKAYEILERGGIYFFGKDKEFTRPSFYATSIIAEQGFSGSPLFDNRGRLIGIASCGGDYLYFTPVEPHREIIDFLRKWIGKKEFECPQ